MSEHVNETVSALRAVLARSAAMREELDLKKGWFVEARGFDTVAQELIDEYAILVGLRTDIRTLLGPVRGDLRGDSATELGRLVDAFGDVEAAMLRLEATQVPNTTTDRNNHKRLVTAQIDIARPLKAQITVAVRDAVSETVRANFDKKLSEEVTWVKGYKERLDVVQKMKIGTAQLRSLSKVGSAIVQGVDRVNNQKNLLTDKQRAAIRELDEIEPGYREAARVETARVNEERRVEEARLAQQKIIDDWQAAFKAAKKDAVKWSTNGEIAEASEILGPSGTFGRNRVALDRAITALDRFDLATPKQIELAASVKTMNETGALLIGPARAAIASRATDVAAAVQKVTDAVRESRKPVGAEPFEREIKDAVTKIPGLLEEVRTAYRFANHTTEPQVNRRAAQLASSQGQTDKYTRIGGWMNTCGFGGTPRTGPSGNLFISTAVTNINGYRAHISQFAANATIPSDGLESSIDDAMAALFSSASDYTGPHITVEISDDFGSMDNARFFYHSRKFRAGAVPEGERADFEAKMSAQLDNAMSVVRQRIGEVVG